MVSSFATIWSMRRDAAHQHERARVLFFDHTAQLGGGELALLDLVANLPRERYEPVVVLGGDGPLADRLRSAGIETCILPLAGGVADARKDALGRHSLVRLRTIGRCAAYCVRLARLIRATDAHIVHTNSLKADVLGAVAGRLARRPVVWHVRDRITADYLPAPVVKLFRIMARTLPDLVVANSRATLETLRLPGSYATAVVYSGIDLGADRESRAERYERAGGAGHPAPAPLVGIVGRLTPWKGQHVFLAAAARVRKQVPNARFLVIGAPLFGEEAYANELQQLAAELGMADCVEFLGFRADVRQILERMTLLVHASIIAEPFGRVVVEGMAAGLPVVATNAGGVPEIVADGETGMLVPPGHAEAMAEAIVTCLQDPGAARAMGRRGRDRAARLFSAQATGSAVEVVYDRLLGRRDGARMQTAAATAAIQGGI